MATPQQSAAKPVVPPTLAEAAKYRAGVAANPGPEGSVEARDAVEPRAASASTVTVANPTPPTNIAYVAYGSPPMAAMVPNPAGRGAPTYSVDAVLVPAAGLVPNATTGSPIPAAAVALTAIATPIGGSGGTGVAGGRFDLPTGVVTVTAATAEAAGSVVIVTAPGSRAEAPTQAISVMGQWTGRPNQAHPSGGIQVITSLSPNPTPAAGGTTALTVNGVRFAATTVVWVAGVAQTTSVINPLLVTVAAAPRRATAGVSQVWVVTDGITSESFPWTFT